jgi:hypothetical protein
MIEGYTHRCPLCRLVEDGEVLTQIRFEDELLLVTDCVVCRTPMAVAKAHRPHFKLEEKALIRAYYRMLLASSSSASSSSSDLSAFLTRSEIALRVVCPEWDYAGRITWVIDWEQRQIPDHPHCHLRPFPFPGTTMWEEVEW